MKPTPTFNEAQREHQAYVFAFVSRRIRPREEAEDVTVEVFIDAFRHWRHCKGDPKLWLLGIARRKFADAYRKRKPTFTLNEDDEPQGEAEKELAKLW